MEQVIELAKFLQEGFYTTIICMFLFWWLPIDKIKTQWLLEITMRTIIVLSAFVITWLSNELGLGEWDKGMLKEGLITLAFSSLFYEFAGKFIVRKWFKNYKTQKT